MEHCVKCGKSLPKILGIYFHTCYNLSEGVFCETCYWDKLKNERESAERIAELRKSTPNNGCNNCGSTNADSFDADNLVWLCEKCFWTTKYGEDKYKEVLDSREKIKNEKVCGSINLFMKERQFQRMITLQKYKFDDVISYQLIENGNVERKGGIGGAIVGGVVAGVPGALIGYDRGKKSKNMCTEYRIVIRMRSGAPLVIGYIGGGTSVAYDSAQFLEYRRLAMDTIKGIEIILNENEKKNIFLSNSSGTLADEIVKLKSLLD